MELLESEPPEKPVDPSGELSESPPEFTLKNGPLPPELPLEPPELPGPPPELPADPLALPPPPDLPELPP